jgi:hypothetical protein
MLMTKFIGKPYAGKSHVRFDEGAGVAISLLLALLYWLICASNVPMSNEFGNGAY